MPVNQGKERFVDFLDTTTLLLLRGALTMRFPGHDFAVTAHRQMNPRTLLYDTVLIVELDGWEIFDRVRVLADAAVGDRVPVIQTVYKALERAVQRELDALESGVRT